jgi:hypothetical protein
MDILIALVMFGIGLGLMIFLPSNSSKVSWVRR